MKQYVTHLSTAVMILVSLFSGQALAQKQVLVGAATVGTSPYVMAVGFTTLANKHCPNYKFMVQA